MSLTADTITDEQIRELCRELERDRNTAHFALLADPQSEYLRAEVRAARARCAEILNARAKEPTGIEDVCVVCGEISISDQPTSTEYTCAACRASHAAQA